MNENNELKGLGGWLVLVGIGVVVGPFRIAYEFGPLYYSIFTDGSFEYLTTPGTEAYHQLWGLLLVFEAVCNSLIVLASLYLIYLFFSKHYIFPKAYIAIGSRNNKRICESFSRCCHMGALHVGVPKG